MRRSWGAHCFVYGAFFGHLACLYGLLVPVNPKKAALFKEFHIHRYKRHWKDRACRLHVGFRVWGLGFRVSCRAYTKHEAALHPQVNSPCNPKGPSTCLSYYALQTTNLHNTKPSTLKGKRFQKSKVQTILPQPDLELLSEAKPSFWGFSVMITLYKSLNR